MIGARPGPGIYPRAKRRQAPKVVISMPVATASVPTVNAAKYMQQLCKHWSHKLEVDLSEQRGEVKFPAAVATFEPRPEALKVTIEGEEGEAVERMKGVIASHLDRFAFREAPLRFDWSEPQEG
jgi:hypothetical protein